MNKSDVIEFFDRCAPSWDAELIKSSVKINRILDNAEVSEGMDILDVACGTGVMFPYYLERNVNSVTAIDISPKMAAIAAEKVRNESKITVLCGDVEETSFHKKFDRIVVYNAFPHFPDPVRLIRVLSGLLKDDGRLTIAHGASREVIDSHHKGPASKVSNGLMPAEDLKKIFDPYIDVEIMISNSEMYQVSGLKRSESKNGQVFDVGDDREAIAELKALAAYYVSHNDSHIREMSELADRLQRFGYSELYSDLSEAVTGFYLANSRLQQAVEKIR